MKLNQFINPNKLIKSILKTNNTISTNTDRLLIQMCIEQIEWDTFENIDDKFLGILDRSDYWTLLDGLVYEINKN
jgi:hypothetical protein